MLAEEDVRALMEAGEAEVDLEALEVRFAGRAVPFELDAERRHRLLNGLDDIDLTLQKAEDIDAYEASRERPGPVTLNCRVPQLMPNIALLPGDGIGPEVAAAAVEVLNAVAADLTFEEHPAGGAAIDAHGVALTDEALAACKASDAVLLGALGGPKWDTNEPGAVRAGAGAVPAARRARAVRQPAPDPPAAARSTTPRRSSAS